MKLGRLRSPGRGRIARVIRRGGVLALGITLLASSTAMGFKAYVTNSGDDDVSVIDTDTRSKLGPDIAVGNSPEGLDMAFGGGRAFVANSLEGGSGTVSVINTITGGLTGSPVSQPGGLVDVAIHRTSMKA